MRLQRKEEIENQRKTNSEKHDTYKIYTGADPEIPERGGRRNCSESAP